MQMPPLDNDKVATRCRLRQLDIRFCDNLIWHYSVTSLQRIKILERILDDFPAEQAKNLALGLAADLATGRFSRSKPDSTAAGLVNGELKPYMDMHNPDYASLDWYLNNHNFLSR